MRRPALRSVALVLALLAACGETTPPRLTGARYDVPVTDAVDDAVDASDAAPNTPDRPALPMFEVARFDATRAELPDALTTRNGQAYVALRPLGRVLEVSPDGYYRAYAEVPRGLTVRGIAFDQSGVLHLTVVGTDAAQTGVWRAPPGGGMATLLVRDDALRVPGGITFDPRGVMWVTDDDPGAVWRRPPGGQMVRWSNDPLLAGGAAVCGPTRRERTGAHGIAVDVPGATVFVTNPDRSTVVRVPFDVGDVPRAAAVITARDCARLSQPWGLAFGPGGDLLVTASASHGLARVTRAGVVSLVSTAPGLLRSPAGVAWDADNQVVWVVSSANEDIERPGGNPLPGVARIPLR